MKNCLLIICMIIVLSGCASKSEEAQGPVTNVSPEQSIFTAPELEFMAGSDVFNFKDATKMVEDVEQRLEKAQEEQVDTTALLVVHALLESQIGDNDVAFDEMTKAIQAKSSAELYALRGVVLWRGGKYRGAMRDAEYALVKQKDLALANMVQGLVLHAEQNVVEACTLLESACQAGQCYGLNYAKEKGQCN